MAYVGYEHLRESLRLTALPVARPAQVRSVTRVESTDTHLAIPRHVAPASEHPLDHLLFAFKHEGMNLAIACEALRNINPSDLIAQLQVSPNGAYIRKACYLWEQFAGRHLEGLPEVGGPTEPVFDPDRYVTIGEVKRDRRWRVAFNGLGTVRYCATVERTPMVQAGMASDVMGRAIDFAKRLSKPTLDRALAWAYLSETEDSFAIEREKPSADKAEAFVQLLKQAHQARPLSEEYLVDLQNSVVTNPMVREVQFRVEQNWLRGPARGALGITYVPPAPALADELMNELMAVANHLPQKVDPVIAAAIASFGFVFIHPFMDGNGRLSRFLFHHAMCLSGALPDGLLLPVSVAMKRHEDDYLTTLQSFSKPARARWKVRWISDADYEFSFDASSALYRYWDATACVEFSYRMAEQALEHDLRGETLFLTQYDRVLRTVNERYDIPGKDIATILMGAFDQHGTISKARRRRFEHLIPGEALDFIEAAVRKSMATDDGAD